MSDPRADLRAWLRTVLERTGDSPTALARRAGLAQTTITRFLNDDDGPLLGTRSISKIAHATGLSPPGISPAPADVAARAAGGFAEVEASPYEASGEPVAAALSAMLAGRQAAAPWRIKTSLLEQAGVLPGDIVIVDLNATPAADDLVCAQIYHWSAGKAQTVFRLYDPPYLLTATSARGMRKPLLVDNEHVVIKGVVTELIRSFAAR